MRSVHIASRSQNEEDEIRYWATLPQRPTPTRHRHTRSVFGPNGTSLKLQNNIWSQTDAIITPSTPKKLVGGTTLSLPSLPLLPNPFQKRDKPKNTMQRKQERTYLFSIIPQILFTSISGTFSKLSISSISRWFRRHRIAIASNAPSPCSPLECNGGGTPIGLCRTLWSCDDSGVEFVVMTVSDQERPEVGEWLSVRFGCVGSIVMLDVMCSVESEVQRFVVESW